MLPIRVEFENGIHPAYYLQKVAKLHGYFSLKDMIKAFGMKMPINYNGNIERYNDIIKYTTGIDAGLTERNGFEYSMTRHITSLVHVGVNVCPCCLDERKVNFENRYVTSTYCNEHMCKTEQFCYHCGARLEWDNNLLAGCCSSCGQRLQVRHSDIPVYLRFLFDLDDAKVDQFLDDLTLTAGFILRPYDIVPERVNRDVICDWEQTFEQAFSLLTNRGAIENWLANIAKSKERDFTDILFIYAGPRYLLRNVKMAWPTLNNLINALEHNSKFDVSAEMHAVKPKDFGIKPNWKTKGLTHVEQDTLARNKCSIDVVSDILGCSESEVSSLITNGYLTTLKSIKTGVSAQIDIRQIGEILSKISLEYGDIKQEPMLAPSFLSLYNCNMADVLVLVKKQPNLFKITTGTSSLLGRLRISNKAKYIKAFLSIFKSRFNEKISVDDAVKMFGFTDRDFRALWQQELAFALPWQQSAKYFRLADLVRIDRKVFNLKRYCLTKGLNFSDVQISLENKNIRPIAGDSLYQCKIQVLAYLKRGEVIEAENLFKPKMIINWPTGRKLTA